MLSNKAYINGWKSNLALPSRNYLLKANNTDTILKS